MKSNRFFLLLFIPILFILPFINQFLFNINSDYNDLVISHLPNALFVHQAISNWGQIPLWSDTILSGYPLIADPLSGLWYPLDWITFLFPTPAAVNWVVILHILWAGIGVYYFLRLNDIGYLPSAIGGLSLELMPKMISHFGAGHVSLIYAFSWTPWFLIIEKKYLGNRSTQRDWLQIILFLMVILADLRWLPFAFLLWFFYRLYLFRNKNEKFWKFVFNSIKPVFFSVFLAAPVLFPFFQFVRLSSRNNLTIEDNLFLSLHPANLISFFVPNIGGNTEWVVYLGLAFLFLIPVYLWNVKEKKVSRFWCAIFLFGIIYSFGKYLPGMNLISLIPGFNLIRVPSRSILLCGLAASIITAYSLQYINNSQPTAFMQKKFPLITASLMLFIMLISSGLYWLKIISPAEFIWGGIGAFALGALMIIKTKGWINNHQWLGLITVLIFFDLAGIDFLGLKTVPLNKELDDKSEIVEYLKQQNIPFRLYTPSYSLSQMIGVYHQFEYANGINPLQLNKYVSYMAEATGVQNTKYSVTLPPFVTGNPKIDNKNAALDLPKLGRLNVKYILSEFPITMKNLALRTTDGVSYLYENLSVMPRAWVQESDKAPGSGYRIVNKIRLTPNEIEISADGPGMLVLSEIDYPGWKVFVDGVEKQMVSIDGIFRGVRLDDQEYHVRFSFQPSSFYSGLIVSFITVIFLGIQTYIKMRSNIEDENRPCF